MTGSNSGLDLLDELAGEPSISTSGPPVPPAESPNECLEIFKRVMRRLEEESAPEYRPRRLYAGIGDFQRFLIIGVGNRPGGDGHCVEGDVLIPTYMCTTEREALILITAINACADAAPRDGRPS